MDLSSIIERWLDAEQAGEQCDKRHTRQMLVTSLWQAYKPMLYALARKLAPGQQSDILDSAFLKFFEQIDRGTVAATTRDDLHRILMKRVLDKVFERRRKETRRRSLRPILGENVVLPALDTEDDSSGIRAGIDQWAAASEPPPEFGAIINEMLETVADPDLHQVLLLKIEHLLNARNPTDVSRANVEIAKIIGISDREVGRRLEEVREILAPWRCGGRASAESAQEADEEVESDAHE